jgi:hypothetical protein
VNGSNGAVIAKLSSSLACQRGDSPFDSRSVWHRRAGARKDPKRGSSALCGTALNSGQAPHTRWLAPLDDLTDYAVASSSVVLPADAATPWSRRIRRG